MRRAVGFGADAILDIGGARPAALHVGERRRLAAGIGEGEAGEAAVGDHDQRVAEGRGMEAVADVDALAARLVGAGRHGLVGDEEIVQPAGAGQADLVGRVENRSRIGEQRAGMIEGQRLDEALRRQARPAGEQALQGERLQPDMAGDALQRRLLAPAPRDELDGAANDFVVGHAGFDRAWAGMGGRMCGHGGKVHRGFLQKNSRDVVAARWPSHPILACPDQAPGPRAFARAAEKAVAKLSRSAGGRKAPMARRAPCEAMRSAVTPTSGWRSISSRAQ